MESLKPIEADCLALVLGSAKTLRQGRAGREVHVLEARPRLICAVCERRRAWDRRFAAIDEEKAPCVLAWEAERKRAHEQARRVRRVDGAAAALGWTSSREQAEAALQRVNVKRAT